MKNIRKIVNTVLLGSLFCGGITSCDYLDVSKEIAENLTLGETFENTSYTKRWYGNVYNVIPNYSEIGKGATSGQTGIWSIMAGEVCANTPAIGTQMINGFNSSDASFHRWATCYKYIRQGLIFLENAKDEMGIEGDKNYVSRADMARMKAEIKYLIAYSYFLLFELYGPVPLVTQPEDPENKSIDYPRASIDEVVGYIDQLLQEVIESNALPETLIVQGIGGEDYDHNNDRYTLKEIVRPTKVTALALRARLWVYAASPLFNGEFQEALAITNKDGQRLFPDKDKNKWNIAKQHLEALLSFAESKGHKLYYAKPGENGESDPNLSVYELFQYYNNEILWANGNNNYKDAGADMEKRSTPRGVYSGWCNIGLYQEGVDAFFTQNGLTINEDKAYNEDGFGDLVNVISSERHKDRHIFNMYHNREPRFYATVTYEGRSWHYPIVKKDEYGTFSSKGGDSDNSSQDHPKAGYLLYKFKNRQMLETGNYTRKWARPWILFRLADFYLYYAEACNEIDPSNPKIIDYLDAVRKRAGIPGYKELASTNVKNIIGNYEAQKEAIRRERKAELFAEGNYYFDVHRWMSCIDANSDDQPFKRTGMNLNVKAADFDSNKIPTKFYDKVGPGSFYERTVIEDRVWNKSMLLYPVPYNEIQKSKLLVQNPLWN